MCLSVPVGRSIGRSGWWGGGGCGVEGWSVGRQPERWKHRARPWKATGRAMEAVAKSTNRGRGRGTGTDGDQSVIQCRTLHTHGTAELLRARSSKVRKLGPTLRERGTIPRRQEVGGFPVWGNSANENIGFI